MPFSLLTVSGIGQLITVLLIFVFVLVITAVTTRWIANFQKTKAPNSNIEVIESTRIAQNKLVEIVRIGDKYFAIALGKDTVTLISELEGDSLKFSEEKAVNMTFREFLNRAKGNGEETK